jgi:anti-sigma regulatory factor (Ser/Thr protein kinase)
VAGVQADIGVTDLESLRHLVAGAARRAGLRASRVTDLVIAVNEAVTNAIRHATGRARVTIIHEAWDRRLVVQVGDDGPGIPPEYVSRLGLPDPDALGGRGLYLIRALCDEVAIAPGAAGVTGTLVRLVMSVDDR